jgi:hypothetical protein
MILICKQLFYSQLKKIIRTSNLKYSLFILHLVFRILSLQIERKVLLVQYILIEL